MEKNDELALKQAYIEVIAKDSQNGEKSYNKFQKEMKKLVVAREKNLEIVENNEKCEEILQEMQQILDGKHDIELDMKFKDIEDTEKNKEDTIEILTFIQKMARFFKKRQILMNIPFVKKFVNKKLNVLSPPKNRPK